MSSNQETETRLAFVQNLTCPTPILKFPISWIKCHLEATASRFLKRWAGLAKPTNLNLLYHTKKKNGLELPSLSSLYKHLQAPHQSQPLTSANLCVNRIAKDDFQAQAGSRRVKLCPAVVVRDVMRKDSSRPRRALAAAVKRSVTQSEREASKGERK